MRLRLNKTLRAALIAAVSTFALATTASAASTGTQTFGEDVVLERGDTVFGQDWYVTKDMTAGTATANLTTLSDSVNIRGGNCYASDYTVSIWVSAASLEDNCLLFAYAGSGVDNDNYGANAIFWDAAAHTITIGRGKVTNSFTSVNWQDHKTSSDLSSYLGADDMVNFTFAVSGGDQSMTPTIWVNGESRWTADAKYAGNMNKDASPLNLYVGSDVTYGNVSITNEKLTTQDAVLTLMGLSKTAPSPSTDYIWTGNASNIWDTQALNWKTSESETPVAFVPGEDNTVTFNSTGTQKAVSLAADTTIGSVTVDGAAYTLDLDGRTLTTGTLAVKNTDASLALTGTGAVDATSIDASGKTINIGENVVLKGSGSATLDGKGTYALTDGTYALGSIVLGENWTGTVRVTSASVNNLVFSTLTKGTASTLELKGYTGWSNQWKDGTNNENIKLTNPGEGAYAWTNRADTTTTGLATKFTGKWSGNGTFAVAPRALGYTFKGDISEWTGAIVNIDTRSFTSVVTFADNATDVKASITDNATAKFAVVVSTNAVFSNSVSVHGGLTVDAGKTATFNGTTSFSDGVTLASDAKLVNGGALTINGTITFGANAIENNGSGTITFGSGIHFDLTGMTAVENKYTLFSGTGAAIDLSGYNTSNITVAGGTAGKAWSFNNDGTISYTMSGGKVWTDGAGTGKWNYEDANWDGSKFEEGDVAQFNVYSEVTVNADVVAGGIQADSVVFISNDEATPGSLSSPSVVVAEGAYLFTSLAVEGVEAYSVGSEGAWSISAAQTLAAGTGSGDGVINVMEGGSVTFTGTATEADWTRVASNDGTVTMNLGGATARFDMSDSSGVLAVSNGKVDYRSNLDNQTLQLGNGTTLLFGDNDGAVDAPVFTNDIVLAGDATIQVHGTSKHSSVTISGDVTGASYTLTKDDGNQTTTFEGKITVNKFVTGDNSTGTTVIKNGATIANNLSPHKGILEIHGDVSVGHELDLSNSGACTATVKIAADGAATVKDGMWMGKSAHVELLEGGKLALTNAGLSLVGRSGGGSVTTTADNGQYSVGNNTFTISGADVTATKAVTIGNKLENSSISTGEFAVSLTNTANVITGATVAASGSLSMTSGSLKSAITNSGSVTLTNVALDATGFEEQGGGTGYYDVSGNKLADDTANHYVGTNESYVQVVNNAQGATSTGTAVWKDQTISLETDGRIVTGSGAPIYDTFYIVAGSENISDIAKNKTTAINVSAGALVVDEVTSGITITVTDEGTISGDKADAKQVGIAADATAYYTGAVEDSGVRFSPGGDMSEVVIVNNGDATKTYSTTDKALSVAAQKLEMIDTQNNVTVSNTVVVDELVNTTGKVLTLDNTEALLLNSMTITGSTVEVVYTNEQMAPVEGTVMIADALSAGGATLKADLTLYGGSTLDVDGGAANALTLGSTLAIDTTDGLVNLDQETIAALNALEVGQSLDLIKALQGTQLEYDGAAAGAQWYGDLFNRAEGLVGDYTVYTTGDAFGLTRFNNVPEPTTGTLSLLALAALAARRRRK